MGGGTKICHWVTRKITSGSISIHTPFIAMGETAPYTGIIHMIHSVLENLALTLGIIAAQLMLPLHLQKDLSSCQARCMTGNTTRLGNSLSIDSLCNYFAVKWVLWTKAVLCRVPWSWHSVSVYGVVFGILCTGKADLFWVSITVWAKHMIKRSQIIILSLEICMIIPRSCIHLGTQCWSLRMLSCVLSSDCSPLGE